MFKLNYVVSESCNIRARFFPAIQVKAALSPCIGKNVAIKLTEGAVDKLRDYHEKVYLVDEGDSWFLVVDGEKCTCHQEAATRWPTGLCSYRSDSMALAGPWAQETGSRIFFSRDATPRTIDVVRAPMHMRPSSVNWWALSPALQTSTGRAKSFSQVSSPKEYVKLATCPSSIATTRRLQQCAMHKSRGISPC